MTIAFVPVRGGSKSIPHKNIKSFCGHPLVTWVIRACQIAEIDQIVVATDDDGIEEVVRSYQFDKVKVYRRQADNATDTASTESVLSLIHI